MLLNKTHTDAQHSGVGANYLNPLALIYVWFSGGGEGRSLLCADRLSVNAMS